MKHVRTTPPPRIALFLMAVCFGSAVAHAQTSSDPPNLFEEVSTGAASTEALRSGDLSQLSLSDLTRQTPALQSVTAQQFEALQNTPGAVQTRFVRIPIRNDLDGLTAITANAGGKKFIATLDRMDVLSAKAYAWEGTIRVDGMQFGNVTLVNENGTITGVIRTDDHDYRISAVKPDLYAVTEIDPETAPQLSGPDYGTGTSATDEKAAEAETEQTESLRNGLDAFERDAASASSSSTVVETQRVLVLYNSDAASAVTNISGTISAAVQSANSAYANSRVSNVRLVLAAARFFVFRTTPSIGNDVTRLADDPQAQALRNQYDADVVVLLTDEDDYANPGVALEVHPSAENAYAIVQANIAVGDFNTFAHEVGHLQSAQHHPEDPLVPNKPYPYGRGDRFSTPVKLGGITVDRKYHATAMAYTAGRKSTPLGDRPQYHKRIPYFSNPSVEYRGVATGRSTRNNASVLRATARRVATFRGVGAMSASISYTNSSNYYTFTANTSGAVGSLTYEWRTSLNSSSSYGGVVSRQRTYTTSINPDNILYTKVTVRSSSGQVATAYRSVYVPPDGGCFNPPCQLAVEEAAPETAGATLAASTPDVPTSFALHAAYPNPFNPTAEIAFDLPEASDVRLAVYDVMGREVTRLAEGPMGAGSHRVRFEAAGLPSGVYLYRLEAGTFAQTERMTLVK